MSIDLTPEQRQAVERRDGSLFVRAGAGSGKTRVLVERFVAAVREDGLAVDRILAITFTEKAAAEMRSRVRVRLLELGERELARDAEGAAISTIHAFCSRVLRSGALAAGLDPEYVVLDEPGAARIAIDAFDLALADFLAEAGAGDALDLAATYTPDRLRSMVTTVHGRLRSRGEEPALPPLDPPADGGERDRLALAVREAVRELGPQAGAGKTVDRALGTLERCDRSLRALGEDQLADPADIAEWAVKGGSTRALGTPVFQELADAHAAYLTYCEATRAAADHALLARLLALFARHYATLKDGRSALDFDDLELRARDLVRADAGIRGALRERYAQVMVDEFQDVNPLQAELLDLVAHDNLFAVGDEDQSIYGFRHADVQLFRDRRAAAEQMGRAVALRANFRSRPEVLAAVDATFGAVWAERGFEPLVPPPGAAPAGPPRVDPSVELLLVDGSRKRWEEAFGEEPFGPAPSKLPPWRLAEARLLAERIAAVAGPDGPYGYDEVALLMRAGSDMAVYERALVERGIPAYAHGARGWWEAQQVGDLRAYLAALANPLDELALTMVLASPLAGVSLGTVACLRLRSRALHRGLWWALAAGFLPDGDGSGGLAAAIEPGDRERLAAFVRRFADERARAPRLSLEALIDRAVTDSGYDRVVLSMPAGDRRLANVRKLMRLARRFEADGGRDVRRFIDHLDERRLLGAREGEAPVEGESRDPAVRLMTVHAAKGLEFPVVCVADLGRSGKGDSGSGLEVSEDGRVGLRLASLSGETRGALDWERLKQEQTERAEEEERRIFHVAMTRAREHLILSGAVDPERWPEPRPLGVPADWIWRALAPGAKDLLSESHLGVDERQVDRLGELRVRCALLTPDTVEDLLPAGRVPAAPGAAPEYDGEPGAPPASPPAFTRVPAPRSLPVARLSYSALEGYNRCGYRFYLERVAGLRGPDRSPALARAAASGAGQMVLSLEDRPPPPAEPPGVSALLRGTLVHELLESFDFERPAAPPFEQVEARIQAHGAPVTPEEVERIRGLVDAFARSPLRERVAAGRRARRELPFAFELAVAPGAPQALLVNGVLDVHVEEEDGVLVVDYKTDPLEGADPAPIVADRYATQRLVYGLAALRSGAPRATVAYCFLEAPDAPVEETFAATDAAALESRLLELASGVLEGRFEPTREPHRELCITCPGRAALCEWGPDRTLREHPAPAIPS
jgi:ATP-dependent exoDNAse (exonuclease V) beta subunit